MSSFPVSLEQITVEFITKILQDKCKIPNTTKVLSFTSKILSKSTTTQTVIINLEYDQSADISFPSSLFIKFPSQATSIKLFMNTNKNYEREIYFYNSLLPQSPIKTPNLYYSQYDSSTGDFILILENLENLKIFSQFEGCNSFEDAKLILYELAKFHSYWWDSKIWDSQKILFTYSVGPEISTRALISLQKLLEDFPDYVKAVGLDEKKLDLIGENFYLIFEQFKNAPFTIIHGDFKLDNIFFDVSKNQPVIVDFQLSQKGNIMFDMAKFIVYNLTPELRAAKETELVEFYYDSLDKTKITSYLHERFINEYRLYTLILLGEVAMVNLALKNKSYPDEESRMAAEKILPILLERVYSGNVEKHLTALQAVVDAEINYAKQLEQKYAQYAHLARKQNLNSNISVLFKPWETDTVNWKELEKDILALPLKGIVKWGKSTLVKGVYKMKMLRINIIVNEEFEFEVLESIVEDKFSELLQGVELLNANDVK